MWATDHFGLVADLKEIAPESQIVWVDNDPIVLTHTGTILREAASP